MSEKVEREKLSPAAVVIERQRPEVKLADRNLDGLLDDVDRWFAEPGGLDRVPSEILSFAVRSLVHVARDALKLRDVRKLDESGSDLPPLPPELGDGGDKGPRTCGSCSWSHPGQSQDDNTTPVGLCHVDPPIVWKGVEVWRFLRPEVQAETPGCSRWKKGA